VGTPTTAAVAPPQRERQTAQQSATAAPSGDQLIKLVTSSRCEVAAQSVPGARRRRYSCSATTKFAFYLRHCMPRTASNGVSSK